MKLQGKVAVVSGSSNGIGKGIASVLLSEGATVSITGRNRERLERTYSEFKTGFDSKKVFKFKGDLCKTETVKRLMNSIIKKYGRLDIVVANIGSGRSKPGWDIDDDYFQQSLNVNFFPAVRLARESLKIMTMQKSGSITFISSIAGCEAIPAPVPYSTAKAALLTYVKNTSDIVARYGIRMNAISPGNIYFKGGTWDGKLKENRAAVNKYIKSSVPMQRLGTPEEIGHAVSFLASDGASFITGSNLVVDGGQVRKIL